ncbi:MAG: acyl-CoA dehydrogenase family protein [Halobacteriales archaeon]|nr:acyl-CoA dehydrogenase family protein [Halobacteriales archaeon]
MHDGAPFLERRHDELRAKARAVSLARLEPLEARAEHDLAGASRDAVRILAEEGILRCVVPEAHGGASKEVEARNVVAAREGIAYGSGLADALLALQGLGSLPITLAGSDEQRKAWLPKVASGNAIAGFAVTEPEAGSDIGSMTTRAMRTDEGGWELTGTKTFISNAGIADFYVLFAKTDPAAGTKGITAFLVPGEARGLATEPLKLMAAHPVGTLTLDRVALPVGSVIGTEGKGYALALQTLDRMRPTVAAAACGMAGRALDEALTRARTRKQFGQPIGQNQGLRWKLAEAATDLHAARLLTYRAAWLKDRGEERITLEGAEAKLFATEAAQRIVDLAMQVHGGSGQVAGSVVERLYREVRALRIYEGTSEVLRDIIGKSVMGAT